MLKQLAAVATFSNVLMVVSADVERRMVYLNTRPIMKVPLPCDGKFGESLRFEPDWPLPINDDFMIGDATIELWYDPETDDQVRWESYNELIHIHPSSCLDYWRPRAITIQKIC